MSFMDKAKNAVEKARGTAKDKVGGATGNKDLQAEGKGDKASGSLKNAGENVKDAFKS